MSYVSTVLLTHSFMEECHEEDDRDVYPIHKTINAFFADGCGFREIDGDLFGGTKEPECVLLAGAFNYLDAEGFRGYLASLPWLEPQCVQVWMMVNLADRFDVFDWQEPPQ